MSLTIFAVWTKKFILGFIGIILNMKNLFVKYVAGNIPLRARGVGIGFVRITASQLTGDQLELTMRKENVSNVENFTVQTNMGGRNIVRDVPTSGNIFVKFIFLNAKDVVKKLFQRIEGLFGVQTHVVSVRIGEIQPVYNLQIKDVPEYFANGILVHNCRYFCMSRPMPKAIIESSKAPYWSFNYFMGLKKLK